MSNWWIEEYKKFHKEKNDYGNGGALKFHKLHIDDLITDTKSETLLDFGCGKGNVYDVNDWSWPIPTLYDPAIPEYNKLPDGTFHGVFSSDVMEHIPEEQIPEVIYQIFSRAERFVYLGIANNEAKAILSDGSNAHVTRRPVEWWKNQVEIHAPKKVYTHIKTYGDSDGYAILHEEIYLEWMVNDVGN
jgi:hypothetical protein